MSKSKLRRMGSVYALSSKYTDYDSEVLGVYTSREALAEGFRDIIKDFGTVVKRRIPDEEVERLLTALLEHDSCEIGFAAYSFEELPLLETGGEDN